MRSSLRRGQSITIALFMMSRPELLIITLVYIAALVLGMRATALALPTAQEVGFAVAAIAASTAAALLYQRRRAQAAPAGVKLAVGALLAALAVVVGLVTQVLWHSMIRPNIALPIAAVATLAAPFVIFPMLRVFRDEATAAGQSSPIGEMHVVATAAVAVLLLVAASFIPVPGRSSVRLVGKSYPSLFLGLPQWEAEQDVALMEFGSIKLKDPNNPERFLALRWTDSDPVPPDEHVQTIAVGGLTVRDRSPAFVGKHEGATFYLESDDRLARAAATIWNCPQDHRVLWIFSYLSGPRSAMLATHEKIIKNVHCHTGRNREVTAAAAATQRVFPSFTPPIGFEPFDSPGAMTFANEESGAEIAFDAAVPGRSDVISEDVSPEVISRLLTNTGLLRRVEGQPTLTTLSDLQGHARRVWSVVGIEGGSGAAVQVELMIWHCDKRNMTFIGRYATHGRHEQSTGIDALLPAACHQ